MSGLLLAEGIVKSFGATRVLRGITMEIGRGEVVGLFGPNGSGKTTMANIISGLLLPDRGRVLFEGKDVTRMTMDARFRAGIARTFQIPDPYPSLTVVESVRVALLGGQPARRARGEEKGGLEEELDSLLVRTGLFAQRFWPAAKLSQGCLRRLEFARAISCRPRLILLDEVFSALSARDEAELVGLMRTLHREERISFLVISHNPLILEELCDRVVAIEDGRVFWEGKPGDLARYVPAANHGHEGELRDEG
ncbi:MAG TPA: ATP-binding cassette domain-containing protein [Candidatus Deferrimicrobiaceae bacterium]|jgi:branched-chain amino acid transport system ATP-binding protein